MLNGNLKCPCPMLGLRVLVEKRGQTSEISGEGQAISDHASASLAGVRLHLTSTASVGWLSVTVYQRGRRETERQREERAQSGQGRGEDRTSSTGASASRGGTEANASTTFSIK